MLKIYEGLCQRRAKTTAPDSKTKSNKLVIWEQILIEEILPNVRAI